LSGVTAEVEVKRGWGWLEKQRLVENHKKESFNEAITFAIRAAGKQRHLPGPDTGHIAVLVWVCQLSEMDSRDHAPISRGSRFAADRRDNNGATKQDIKLVEANAG
jgi:hypothetical protein